MDFLVDLVEAFGVENIDYFLGHFLATVRGGVRGPVSTTISEQIRSDDAVAQGGEVGYLVAPVVARRREAMEEEEVGFILRWRNGDIAVSGPSGSSERFGVFRKSYCCHVEDLGAGLYCISNSFVNGNILGNNFLPFLFFFFSITARPGKEYSGTV